GGPGVLAARRGPRPGRSVSEDHLAGVAVDPVVAVVFHNLQPVEVVRPWLEGSFDPDPGRGGMGPIQMRSATVERFTTVLLLERALGQADVGLLRHPASGKREHRGTSCSVRTSDRLVLRPRAVWHGSITPSSRPSEPPAVPWPLSLHAP